MYGLHDNEIPGAGKVDMNWVATPLPPVVLKKEEDDGDAMAVDESPRREKNGGVGEMGGEGGGEGLKNENLDYDVGDEEDYIM